MKQFFLFFLILFTCELFARQIEETTFSYWGKPDAKIFYSMPDSINTNTKIILYTMQYKNFYYFNSATSNSMLGNSSMENIVPYFNFLENNFK